MFHESLMGFKLHSTQARTKDISSNCNILPQDYSGVLDNVISVDMSKEEIESLIIVYGESKKEKNTLSETITVTITPKEPFRIEGEDEKVIVNDREYQFLRSLKKS